MSKSSSAGTSAPNSGVPLRRPPAEPQGALGSWAIAIVTLVAAGAVGAIALQHRAAERDKAASAERQTDTRVAERSAAAPARASAPAAAAAAHPVAAAPRAPKTRASKGAKIIVVPPAAAESPAAAEPRDAERPAPKRADAETSAPAPTPAAAPAETTAVDAVIITGCLEVSANDDRYRLTDTEGDNAPKARSWRTGFLKRRSASVDLVGLSSPRSLERQVGKKVAATGVLTDRSLKVSSLRVVSPSCE